MSAPDKAVFLSYASQDAEAAKRICEGLRAAGVEVWFDADGGLEHGDEWDAKIRRQIKECVLFIPLISANTQAREEGYFRLEWDLAAERARTIASGVAFLLPVVIDGTKEPDALVPDRFRTVQWTRLPGGVMTDEIRQRFLKLWSHRTGLLKHGTHPTASAPAAPSPETVRAAPTPAPARSAFRWLGLAVVVAALAAAGAWQWQRTQAAQRAQRDAALAEIERLIATADLGSAFTQLETVARSTPDDSALAALWPRLAVSVSLETDPPGVRVSVQDYRRPEGEWRVLGQTPLREVRVPAIFLRWKFEREGFVTLERALPAAPALKVSLEPVAQVPAGMVRISGGTRSPTATGFEPVKLNDFYIDRFEVSNREFKAFLDQGGYARADYWQEPFVRAGQTLTRDEVLAGFVDRTGRPGPAGWRDGTYPAGQDDYPVTGISWFEAAAYAQFAGKRLPSVHHWRAAAGIHNQESIVPLSNFAGRGPAARGTYLGMSAAGVYDLAGNAKEWCRNEAGPDVRYILGGAWREPNYMYAQADALSAFDRSESNGFRCIRLIGSEPLLAEADALVVPTVRDYAKERPVGDDAFAIMRSLYAYDRLALEARIESTDDTDPRWRREKVSFTAAYGVERIPAHVFLPKNSAPPYQGIVFFPGSGSMNEKSSDNLRDLNIVAVLVASGRAVIYPVYKGTYERQFETRPKWETAASRDWTVMCAKDVGRAVDYLESRPDFQPGQVAYVGNSWGAAAGIIHTAVEPRFKAIVFFVGGFYEFHSLPEADPVNFASRIKAPTLMLNGRADFRFPLETSQRPMFQALGTAPEHKKHVLYDTGHALRPEQIAGEVYPWLDRYLGLVK
jgi:formylglycine-generating enzyme required for sulfatase activity/dienelactone hydrolase